VASNDDVIAGVFDDALDACKAATAMNNAGLCSQWRYTRLSVIANMPTVGRTSTSSTLPVVRALSALT
jgi:hypothetical protein